ncbi:hypothetical protein [Streptomyces gilvus]|uniref:hypothetical protein n=1 Tax=Streptomyces gilvus TaxID=2920937 RepID=UPI001F106C54|nr:hypothetical protein [Streptomyces sp. CME 23]MCH5671980.1 hypothetical protein [Streptomyces sp. CME 23]
MSVHNELAHAQHALDDLVRSVGRLRSRLGEGPDLRRVRADADHLREDLDLLRQSTAAAVSAEAPGQPEVVFVPSAPYDLSMWVGCEDEGIGSRHGPERRPGGRTGRLSRRALYEKP